MAYIKVTRDEEGHGLIATSPVYCGHVANLASDLLPGEFICQLIKVDI